MHTTSPSGAVSPNTLTPVPNGDSATVARPNAPHTLPRHNFPNCSAVPLNGASQPALPVRQLVVARLGVTPLPHRLAHNRGRRGGGILGGGAGGSLHLLLAQALHQSRAHTHTCTLRSLVFGSGCESGHQSWETLHKRGRVQGVLGSGGNLRLFPLGPTSAGATVVWWPLPAAHSIYCTSLTSPTRKTPCPGSTRFNQPWPAPV